MSTVLRRALSAVLTATLVGCAAGSDPAPPATATADNAARMAIYRSLGGRQCEDGGADPATLRAQLEAAGVTVHATTCGSDGRMYPSVCGAADGRIGIFEISAGQMDAARGAGFAPLSDLPDAQRMDCRK